MAPLVHQQASQRVPNCPIQLPGARDRHRRRPQAIVVCVSRRTSTQHLRPLQQVYESPRIPYITYRIAFGRTKSSSLFVNGRVSGSQLFKTLPGLLMRANLNQEIEIESSTAAFHSARRMCRPLLVPRLGTCHLRSWLPVSLCLSSRLSSHTPGPTPDAVDHLKDYIPRCCSTSALRKVSNRAGFDVHVCGVRDSTTLFFSFRLLIVVAAQCLPFDARGIGAKIGSENMTAGIAIGTGEYGYERDRDDDHYSRGTYDRNRDPNRDYDGGQVEETRSRPRLWKEEGSRDRYDRDGDKSRDLSVKLGMFAPTSTSRCSSGGEASSCGTKPTNSPAPNLKQSSTGLTSFCCKSSFKRRVRICLYTLLLE